MITIGDRVKDETVLKLVAFVLLTVMYVATVTTVSMTPELVQALFTIITALITTVIGYNVGKKLGKRRG